MKRIEVDIWVNQFIGFFDKNPGELTQLIGSINKEIFFDKVRQRCIKNLEEGDEVSLTQKQLIDIIVSLKAAHDKGNTWHGVDVLTGKVTDMFNKGVIEPSRIKKQAIQSASEAAIMILRIDDVIAAGKLKEGPGAGHGGMPPMGMGGMGGMSPDMM